MTPSSHHDPEKLERAIHETLRALPPRRAPRTLEARVLAELERRAARQHPVEHDDLRLALHREAQRFLRIGRFCDHGKTARGCQVLREQLADRCLIFDNHHFHRGRRHEIWQGKHVAQHTGKTSRC